MTEGWEKKPLGWENIDHKQHCNQSKSPTYHSYNWIFVLAGGLNKDGEVYPWVERRLDSAINYYNGRKCKIVCMGGGTYHKPPILNKDSFVIHEATSCASYLIENGVSANDIYKEWSSYDTIANGYFAFTNFIVPLHIENILVITSEFHMPRSKIIFEWMRELFGLNTDINFLCASDDGLDRSIISIRNQRERISVEKLRILKCKINSINKFHKWFYEDHKAYCSNADDIRVIDSTDKEKESY